MKKARRLAGLGVMGTTLQFPQYLLETRNAYRLGESKDIKNNSIS